MGLHNSNSNYIHALTLLYHLMIHADNEVDPRELKMGQIMLEKEGLNSVQFLKQVKEFDDLDSTLVYDRCLAYLKKCNVDQQMRCIAWMAIVANADGFMAREEWKLIHKIYHNELDLSLAMIMALQREINAAIWLS